MRRKECDCIWPRSLGLSLHLSIVVVSQMTIIGRHKDGNVQFSWSQGPDKAGLIQKTTSIFLKPRKKLHTLYSSEDLLSRYPFLSFPYFSLFSLFSLHCFFPWLDSNSFGRRGLCLTTKAGLSHQHEPSDVQFGYHPQTSTRTKKHEKSGLDLFMELTTLSVASVMVDFGSGRAYLSRFWGVLSWLEVRC